MKNNPLFSFRCALPACGLFFVFALLLCGPARAQELLKNPGFEDSIDPVGSSGTTNWALAYADGGPGDFSVADRTTEASRGVAGTFGVQIRARHGFLAHAYFKQKVSNLTPGASYVLSGWMHCGFQAFVDAGKLRVYFSAASGAVTNSTPWASSTRTQYFLTNTAGTNGQIDVELHVDKRDMVEGIEDPKFLKCSGWFDDFSLTLVP